jgi:hypothetical protein
MAVKTASKINTNIVGVDHYLWEALGNADTGNWLTIPHFADKTIHVFGTWGSATLVVQGTNEDGTPAAPLTLTDPQGNALSKTADFIEAILENPYQIRVSTSGGTGTDLDAVLVVSTPRLR